MAVPIRRNCTTCGTEQIFEKSSIDPVIHIALAVVTAGTWIFVWLLIEMANSFTAYRCQECGEPESIIGAAGRITSNVVRLLKLIVLFFLWAGVAVGVGTWFLQKREASSAAATSRNTPPVVAKPRPTARPTPDQANVRAEIERKYGSKTR